MADFRCWVCLSGPDDPPPPNDEVHHWKRPCPCSGMVAHESCLLQWARSRGDQTLECPQCKFTIHTVKAKQSILLQTRDVIEKLNRTGFATIFICTVGGAVVGTVYTTLYSMGATTIRFICPESMAFDLLGVAVNQDNIQLLPPTWKKMMLIPTIPLILLSSGKRSNVVNVLTTLLPWTLVTPEQRALLRIDGPQLTMIALPWVRMAYQYIYDKLIDPIIVNCALKVSPLDLQQDGGVRLEVLINNNQIVGGGAPPVAGVGAGAGAQFNGGENGQLDLGANEAGAGAGDGAGPADDAGQQNAEPDLDQDQGQAQGQGQDENVGFAELMLLRGFEWLVNMFEPPAVGAPQIDGQIVQQDQQALDRPQQQPDQQADRERHRNHRGDWIISNRSLTLKAGYAMLWPLLGGITGEILSASPTVRRLVPDRFNRNIAGALLVILGRDLVNVGTALIRSRIETSTTVVDYDDL